MKDYLIVVDMQKDFVDGALGTKEAVAIVPAVLAKVKKAAEEGQHIIFTRDTHEETYLETQEGHNLPVTHCVRGSEGWEIIPQLRPYANEIFDKPTFGSRKLGEYLADKSDVKYNRDRPLHGYLRHIQCTPDQGISSGDAYHCGRLMLRRRHTGQP